MNYITAENLSKSYGLKTLFKDITFFINEGDKIAIVAKNGSGKSTLLKILMGKEIPDSGEVIINKDIQVVLFDQEIDFEPHLNIEEFMMKMDSPPIVALRNYHHALATGDENLMESAINEMELEKAWDLENEMSQILSQLKITDNQLKMSALSGGQIKRVALAKLLTEMRAQHRHCLLIMDEPTNHLDVEMVEWLENYLSKEKITLLLVTHDRYFLDSVCDIIWEMEDQKLYIHNGAYAVYLENKMIREDNLNANIDKANNLYRKELEWMRRQPKARTTKSKSRIDSFFETEKVAKQNTKKQSLELDFAMKRMGSKILEIENISKSYGDKVLFKNFTHTFQRGDRVGIVGKNGAGKTTLLTILQGLEKPDSGKIETGETIKFGYFSQKGILSNPDGSSADVANIKMIDYIKDISENFMMGNGKSITAAQFLRLFLFDDQVQHTLIGRLSGGEKRRLLLLKTLYENPNFLIFDEPTNDLDLPTIGVLENFLMNFQGCLVVVSHDRYFMDRVTDYLLAFEGENPAQIRNFTGTYTEYREQLKDSKPLTDLESKTIQKDETIEVPIKKDMPTVKDKKKLSFKEQKELDTIEKEMPILESKRQTLTENLEKANDYEEIQKLSSEIQKFSQQLVQFEERWLELKE